MEYKEFISSLKEGIGNLFFLYGRETYLIENAIKKSRELIDESVRDFNMAVLDGSSTSLEEMISDIEMLPFMEDRRIVVVKELDIFGSRRKAFSEKDEKALAEHLKDIPSTTTLIFTYSQEPDKRKSIYKTISKYGQTVECSRVSDMDLFKWIRGSFAKREITINNPEIMLLIETMGYRDKNSEVTLKDMANEIQRLAAYVGRGNTLKREDIQLLLEAHDEADTFKFIECVLERDSSGAMAVLEEMLDRGESVLGIYALLAREIRIIISVGELKEKGINEKQAAKLLNLHPYSAKKAYRAAKTMDEGKALRLLNYISQADYKIKNGLINDEISLEILVAGFAQ